MQRFIPFSLCLVTLATAAVHADAPAAKPPAAAPAKPAGR